MSSRGVHFAITQHETERLLAKRRVRKRVEIITEEIEERMEMEEHRQWCCETDKAWDAIHRCLTDGSLTFSPHPSGLHAIILGDEVLCHLDWYIITLVRRDRVRELLTPLMAVTKENMRVAYEAIDAGEYPDKSAEDFEYTWEWFNHLRAFWQRAAEAERDVIFTVDQ